MDLIWARASRLVRRGWRATVVLALVIGVTSGIAMATIAAGRRTATLFDRYAAYADVPELVVLFCPPGVEPVDEESSGECLRYDPAIERDRIARLPEVETAARGTSRGLTVAAASEPEQTWRATSLPMLDPGIDGATGRLRVVEGRSPEGIDEIAVSEVLMERAGLHLGDEVVLTFWDESERGSYGSDGAALHGPQVEAQIVGVGVGLMDIAASGDDPGLLAQQVASVFMAPELARHTSDAAGYPGVFVEAVGDDADAVIAAVERAFPDRFVSMGPALGDDETEPIREAIRYEAHAAVALGLIAALVVAAFSGQAVVRQSRREWTDGPVLRAVGVTGREASISAAMRGAVIGLPAGVVAAAVAMALSSFGPVGLGRTAELDEGLQLDGPVLLVGALATCLLVVVSACVPLFGQRALRADPPFRSSPRARRLPALPVVASAGLHLPNGGRAARLETGAALAGLVATVVVSVAAVCLTASFADLERTPERFGAPWDLSVGVDPASPPVEELLSHGEVRPLVSAAALITGTDMQIGDASGWVHAFVPIEGVPDTVPLPIGSGRAPIGPREIALGAITLREVGLSLGDTVAVTADAPQRTYEMEIVGTTMVNDTFELSPGRGAAVSPEFIAEAAPDAGADPAVVRLAPGVSRAQFMAVASELHDGPIFEPLQQGAVRNVGRVSDLPRLIAIVVTVLAIASLVHALVIVLARNRRTIGVLKGIGFSRRQVGAAVACLATAYGLTALAAVPLGVVVGRWGWRAVADQLGVPAVSVVPWAALAMISAGVLVLANVAAAYPAWRAARLPTAEALRRE